MSDDTTTWLKKNPAINPLRRSLKASLRFDGPCSAMNSSIMSNPDKSKDQGLFIPRMMQKSSMQMRKSRAHEFKVPEMLGSKVVKKENGGSGVKQKAVPTPNRTRKSMLPVPKTKGQATEKVLSKTSLPRPSFVPGVSGKRTTAKRDLIKKVVELSEIKRKEEAEKNLKAVSGDSSVIRSILKKRASLRRSSLISAKKPKAKKVLFDGFENGDVEKENMDLPSETQSDFFRALDEPTVLLNFPNGVQIDDSPFEHIEQTLNWTIEDTKPKALSDINNITQLWQSYTEKVKEIQNERISIEDSLESLLQHNLSFQKQFQTYKETSEEMYRRLSQLGEEIREQLKKVLEVEGSATMREDTCKRRSTSQDRRRREADKFDKIKMSNKSKVIKKGSGKKSVPLLKKNLLSELEDSFSIISKTNFMG